MTKVNFVRSKTGIVYRLNACSMLQKQLAQAQRALADQRSSHGSTEEFLQHQSNARANAEADIERLRAELEELKAQLVAEESELGEDAQTEEESPAADDINSPPLAQQPEDMDPQPHQTAGESAQTIARLTRELEDLQAEYNVLEDQRDTWREAFEELEMNAEEKVAGDNEHHERRIGALETQLGIEKTSREEAEDAVDGLRDQNEKLREELKESKAQYESLQTAYRAGERAGEEKAAALTALHAEYERLRGEVAELRQAATSTLDASAPEFVPSASPNINQPTASPPETTRPSHSWADEVEDPSGFPDFEINSSLVEDPFHGQDPFPEITIRESSTPAPGPGQARNAHVQKLNEEVKRREWRAKSGMADEEKGKPGPEDVLDDLYDRQVTQALTPPLTRYARGSMFGALNDVPSPVESVSSTPSRQSQGNGEEASGSSAGLPIMLGGYEVTRGDESASIASSEASKEEEIANADGGLAGIEGGEEGTEDEKPEEGEPKAEEEDSSVDSRRSPAAAQQDVPQQVTRARLPSNYWPEVEEQPRTHNEMVGDAIIEAIDELARERNLGSLSESVWAGAEEAPPAAKTTAAEAPGRTETAGDQESSPHQQQHEAPSSSSNQKTHAEQVGDALAHFIDRQAPHSTPLTGSIWATTTPASAGGNARTSSSIRGGRGRGGHHDGIRGGPSTPAHGSPLPPSHGPTLSQASQQQRGGRGRGRGGPAARGGARGSSSAAASDSFRRLQERMARDEAGRRGM